MTQDDGLAEIRTALGLAISIARTGEPVSARAAAVFDAGQVALLELQRKRAATEAERDSALAALAPFAALGAKLGHMPPELHILGEFSAEELTCGDFQRAAAARGTRQTIDALALRAEHAEDTLREIRELTMLNMGTSTERPSARLERIRQTIDGTSAVGARA